MKAANNNFGSFDPNLGMVQQGGAIPSVWKANLARLRATRGFCMGRHRQWNDRSPVRGRSDLHAVASADLGWAIRDAKRRCNSIDAVPTGAAIQTSFNTGCPATGGGTIGLGTATLP